MTEQQRAIALAIREEVRFAADSDETNVLASVATEISLALLGCSDAFDKDAFLSECGLEWDAERGSWQ